MDTIIAYPKAIVPRYTHGNVDEEAAFVDVDLTEKSHQSQGLSMATDDLRKFIGYGVDSVCPKRISRLDTLAISRHVNDDSNDDDDDDYRAEDGFGDSVILSVPEGPTIWDSAKSGDVAAVERAIQVAGEDAYALVNMRDPDSQATLLYLAVAHNRDPVPLIKLLLAHGADATIPNVYSVQAIHALAVHCGGDDYGAGGAVSPMVEALQLLLDNEADANARDGDDWTPLHYVARFCRNEQRTLVPALRLLVRHGAQVNATDASQKTPLFALLANGDHAAALEWLIHSTRCNLGLRAQFHDSHTRRTFHGTVVLQAAKYARRECLRVLARVQDAAMLELRASVSRVECEQAVQWIAEHRSGDEEARDDMLQSVYTIRRRLEQDPASAMAIERRTGHPPADSRRQSFLGSFRRRSSSDSSSNNNSTDGAVIQRSSSLLKRMSQILLSRQRATALDNIA